MPGLSALKPDSVGKNLLQQRRDERQREVAVDDRRHAGQDLEHRLDDAPEAARRVLAEVDRAQQPHRQRHHHRDRRDQHRADDQRQHAEAADWRRAASTRCRSGTRATGTSRRNSNVSTASTTMMPAVVSTESAAHRNSSRSMIHSSVRVVMSGATFRASFASSCSMVTPTVLTPANTEPVRALREALGDQRVGGVAEADVVDFAHQRRRRSSGRTRRTSALRAARRPSSRRR